MASVDDIAFLQRARLYRLATLAAGTFVHLIVCAVVLSVGSMAISPFQLLAVGGVAMAGFALLGSLILVEWNLSLEDPDMSLAQLIWALSVVVITAVYSLELKAVVLFTGAVMVVMGANRLSRSGQYVLGTYGVICYLGATLLLSAVSGPGWVTEAVFILAFGIVLVLGPALYQFESTAMETVITDKNEELSHALEQIREMAIRDELTGLFNRRHLMDVLAHEKAMADRKNYTFSVCFVDLDYFKRVNDRFGHAVGDAVLRDFARVAEDIVREVDCVARMGGEEFVLVLSGTRQEDAVRGAARLAEGLAHMQVTTVEPDYRITASVGITEYRAGEEITQMLERADKALYEAKKTGRNRVVVAREVINPVADPRVVSGRG